MKLLLKTMAVLSLLCGVSFAADPKTVNKSSFTTTNHSGYIAASFLDKIVIAAPTTGGSIAVYNSTWTASVLITSATLSNVTTLDFANTQVKGLWVVTNVNTNGVTVIYK
jgi:hypothetical protein